MLALSDDPQSTRAWQTGARGEVVLGRRLDSLRERGIHVLHDRRIPGTKANIDHMVVSPRGVFVIDAKKYAGAPSLRVQGGLFRPRVESLIIRSRDKTPLVVKLGAACVRVLAAAPWLSVSDAQRGLLSRSDDALDALIACFTARAHALGHTVPVPDALQAVARVEGWIALPSRGVDDLIA